MRGPGFEMKRLIFSLILVAATGLVHAQNVNDPPPTRCESMSADALMSNLRAQASPSHQTINVAIQSAIAAHDCKDAAPATHQGNVMRAKAAVADDLQDPGKVKIMECIGIKVGDSVTPTKTECTAVLQSAGIDAGAYQPAH